MMNKLFGIEMASDATQVPRGENKIEDETNDGQ